MLMVTGLKQSTIRLIRKSKWMSNEAKKMAIMKVNRMKFQVGFDEKHTNELEGLEISNNCLIENLLLLSEKKTNENINKTKEREENLSSSLGKDASPRVFYPP